MHPRCLLILCAILPVLAGCGSQSSSPARPASIPWAAWPSGNSDPEKVRTAGFSILFVGNSHTTGHDLPELVCTMIEFHYPGKTAYSHTMTIGHLDQAANDSRYKEEIESRTWKSVVLQAQKISMSGKYNYSRREGIDLAKSAKARGAKVYFYSEWGLEDVEGDGARNEKIYTEVALQAGVEVARVGRAWDIALAARPDLPLYAGDGNHQSALGAFLTACVLFGRLTCESPAVLASFPYEETNEADRTLLADAAAKALGGK